MALKDDKNICEKPPEIVIRQHPDCNPEFAECEHDNKISIDLVPGECATRGEDPHFKKGYELYHEDKMDDALAEMDESLSVNPQNSEAWLIIGDIYERRRMFDEAIGAYREALKIAPNDKMMQFKLQTALSQKSH